MLKYIYKKGVGKVVKKCTLLAGHNDVQQILVYFCRVPSFIAIQTAWKSNNFNFKIGGQTHFWEVGGTQISSRGDPPLGEPWWVWYWAKTASPETSAQQVSPLREHTFWESLHHGMLEQDLQLYVESPSDFFKEVLQHGQCVPCNTLPATDD